jgi:hypothetical protein
LAVGSLQSAIGVIFAIIMGTYKDLKGYSKAFELAMDVF